MTGTQVTLAAISVLLALAGALGLAWAVFRTASAEKLREIDKQLLGSQEMLIRQQEAEIMRINTSLIEQKHFADLARADLTQKAAVDHLLELVIREEKRRADEHKQQADANKIHTVLLKDIVTILKQLRDDTKVPR